MEEMKASALTSISVLRIAATLAVILLHTCNTITNNEEDYVLSFGSSFFLTSVVYLMNWAVPVFFMITGYLLLGVEKQIGYKDCFVKYSKRMVLALFVFGVPFSMLEIFFGTRNISLAMIPEAFLNVLTGNSWGHLWYLYSLVGIYLILPVLKLISQADLKEQRVLLILLFCFNFCIPLIKNAFDIDIAFSIPVVSFATFYVLLGAYLKREDSKNDNKMFALGIVVAVAGILIVNLFTGDMSEIYLTYNSPLIVLLTTCIFKLCCQIKRIESEKLWSIDRLCFGVYLVHPVFINFIYKFVKVTPLSFSGFLPMGVVIFWILFVAFAFITSWIMKKIPSLKKYIL